MIDRALPGASRHPNLTAALRDWRAAFWTVAIFSGIVNLLVLAGPLYMLQVYDRVLASRSVPTLVALTIFLVGAYAFQGVLDLIRAKIVARAASLLDWHLATTIHGAVVRLSLRSRHPHEAQQPVRDLDQVRAFLTGPGPIAIVDLPWIPVFLAICFLIHPWIGLLSAAGALALLLLTAFTDRASREPSVVASREAGMRAAAIETDRRNGETAVAMGMMPALARRWTAINERYLDALGRSGDIGNSYGSFSKVLRLLMQSAILGLGAYLVIRQELTAGAMIAASIMMGRALAPVETAIANWRAFIGAQQSLARLSQTLGRADVPRAVTALPRPEKSLVVENVAVASPRNPAVIVANVRFQLSAGEALGIVGPSGAGKTSLVRTIVGIWPAAKGIVRIDGAAIDQWDQDMLGRHIGFVSQDVEMFSGTIADNIARMATDPDSEAVLRAARMAGAHDMILRLPGGYDCVIGETGLALSAGQRQRVAFARALYGDPFLVVLDEPHANLDSEGEAALNAAIQAVKGRGAIVILIAHRPSALAHCEKVLFLANGTQQAFGPRNEILQRYFARPAQPAAIGNLKIVSDTTGGGE